MKSLSKLLVGTGLAMMTALTAHGQSLFEEIPLSFQQMDDVATLEGEISSRQVTLNTDVAEDIFDRFSPSSTVNMSLASGKNITLQRTGFDSSFGEGTRLWSGKVEGFEDGHATLILDNNRLIGHVQYNGDIFRISPNVFGMHSIREIDPAALPAEETQDYFEVPEHIMAQDAADSKSSAPSTQAFPTRIRLLVMYTPTAATEALAAGTTIKDEGLLAMGMANTALTNSKMRIYKFKWAGIRGFGKCAYPEPSSTSTVLYNVTSWRPEADSCLVAHIGGIRDAASADMVAVIKGSGGCGTAWYSSSGVGATSAFSVTARACIHQHTFTHELGHNQGLTHDRYATGDIGLVQSDYNFGLAHWDEATPFRTIMSYSNECSANGVSCPRAPVFTNTHPGGVWNGVRTGRGLHLPDPAVSRKKLRETWETMAAHR